MTLASLLQQGHSLRSIAKVLERSPSSLSLELARNGGAAGYTSQPALQATSVRRVRSRPLPKLYADGALSHIDSRLLTWLWSPCQIARTVRRIWPDKPELHVSHKTI
ncbi:helix-turn-helix domain-containing protein [Leptothrix discophora]|uniref:Helix-turn-helix domain-containing protein n=1 Tax=Leptothrix discophora TaxID=89 RepID=A0ABT9G8R4_LEPDI|nr:helix-turn-helix domain-containing protein [Leptothrix discophora]MDP4302687.1 helix-turn-helix domain-containing protein [Leptothrix discophora]